MPSVGDDFQDAAVRRVLELLRHGEVLREDVLVMLQDLEDDLVRQITEADIDGVSMQSARVARSNKLLAATKDMINGTYASQSLSHKKDMQDVVQAQIINTRNVGQKAVGVNIFNKTPSARVLDKLATDSLIEGAPSAEWWKQQSVNLRNRFTRAIRTGVAQGESTPDIVSRIIGTGRPRRQTVTVDGVKRVITRRNGGIMNATRQEAETLVRTSVQVVANDTRDSMMQANQDVVKGRQAVVTLDSRTTDICLARAGGAWDMEGNPLPESATDESYPGPPPWHWNCRTTIIPVLFSWEELSDRLGDPALKRLGEVTPAKRRTLDGKLVDDMDAKSWLNGKTKADQIEILGKGRQALWEKGQITLPQLIDQTGRPRLLPELEALKN